MSIQIDLCTTETSAVQNILCYKERDLENNKVILKATRKKDYRRQLSHNLRGDDNWSKKTLSPAIEPRGVLKTPTEA